MLFVDDVGRQKKNSRIKWSNVSFNLSMEIIPICFVSMEIIPINFLALETRKLYHDYCLLFINSYLHNRLTKKLIDLSVFFT